METIDLIVEEERFRHERYVSWMEANGCRHPAPIGPVRGPGDLAVLHGAVGREPIPF